MQKEIISEEMGVRLTGIATKMEVPVEEVNELYEDKYVKLSEGNVKDNLDRLAYNQVSNHYRRKLRRQSNVYEPKTKATSIIGFLVGTHGMWDKAEFIRKSTKRLMDKHDIEWCKNHNPPYIDEDEEGNLVYLDTRETVFGKDNPDYLSPLSPKLKVRSNVLLGFFRENGNTNYRFVAMQTNDNKLALAWTKVKYFLPCQSFGIVKETVGNEVKMNSSSAEDTMSVFKALDEDIDILDVIIKTIGKKGFTKVSKVEEHYDTYKDAWDRNIIVRGTISWISDRENSWGSVYVGLADAEAGLDEQAQVKLEIPDYFKIDWGEGTEVIVFGKTDRQSARQEDGTWKKREGDVFIKVHGIYPIPGLTVPKSDEVEDVDDDMIDGWFS